MSQQPIDILVHAGFHKTGTSSLQDFLQRNRKALRPHFIYRGKNDFRAAGAAARRYGQRPFPWRMTLFRRRFRAFLATLPDDKRIVLSRETFAGAMPGHRALLRTVAGYDRAAIPLARAIVAELRHRFGPTANIAFLYTTRDRVAWITSVHGHLARSIRMTMDARALDQRLSPEPLDETAGKIATALAPIPVHTAALEDFANAPEGPAKAVLDLMGVPEETRATLKPARISNAGDPPALTEAYMTLNRSVRLKSRLRRAKAGLTRT